MHDFGDGTDNTRSCTEYGTEMVERYFFSVFLMLASTAGTLGQDCDSFVCLREFHENMAASTGNGTTVCSVTQTYVYCLKRSTVMCTSLSIHNMKDVAVLILKQASCNSATRTHPWTFKASVFILTFLFNIHLFIKSISA